MSFCGPREVAGLGESATFLFDVRMVVQIDKARSLLLSRKLDAA